MRILSIFRVASDDSRTGYSMANEYCILVSSREITSHSDLHRSSWRDQRSKQRRLSTWRSNAFAVANAGHQLPFGRLVCIILRTLD